MTGEPNVEMLAGADLVIDVEGVEVFLGAQVEHTQMPSRHQLDQVVGGVISGDDAPRRPVPLPKRTDERGPRVPRAERTRGRIEPVARLLKPLPRPSRGFGRIDSPKVGAYDYAATAQTDRPYVGQWRQITGGKIRHRGRRGSATQCPRCCCGAAL